MPPTMSEDDWPMQDAGYCRRPKTQAAPLPAACTASRARCATSESSALTAPSTAPWTTPAALELTRLTTSVASRWPNGMWTTYPCAAGCATTPRALERMAFAASSCAEPLTSRSPWPAHSRRWSGMAMTSVAGTWIPWRVWSWTTIQRLATRRLWRWAWGCPTRTAPSRRQLGHGKCPRCLPSLKPAPPGSRREYSVA